MAVTSLKNADIAKIKSSDHGTKGDQPINKFNFAINLFSFRTNFELKLDVVPHKSGMAFPSHQFLNGMLN